MPRPIPRGARRPLAGALATLALAGCSLVEPASGPTRTPVPTTPPRTVIVPAPAGDAPPAEQAPEPAPLPAPPPPPPTRTYRLGPATQSLVTQARAQVERGEFDAAAGTLDRAVRIEPRNPLLWLELAQLRLAQKDAKQAEGYGRKALSLATGDRRTQSQASKVVADALKAQGRTQEAKAFEDRARG
jgi:tetratricopeptide (TPR) repeat protein